METQTARGATLPTMSASLFSLILALLHFHLPHPTPTDPAAPQEQESDEKDEEEASWDIEAATGETYEQQIDTDEGTWMSLDVSPDGEEIVFDMLGDLYLLPIDGGAARQLTSGVAWDMQPRFSPDGKEIAFTSDRCGDSKRCGDNIWVIGRDGEGTRQITNETYRLVNGPAWSPDGEFIVARKHFTSRRSLGAGEMWMFHKSGVAGGVADGMQLTEKPTDQKDVNEPVFDSSGRYLYYSEDVSPGESFQYDKDSNGQIYVIQRLDLQDQESERYITGPGGACRPTPSPDGKVIAFVRRVDHKTGLHLFDTTSGAVSLVYDELERDMQETWAIHGVYPAFSWMPNGKSIVLWSRGKIRRVDVHTGESTVIPFHVSDTRKMTRALRFKQAVSQDEFDVRVLRWAHVAPQGERIVYQALGSLYVRDLPAGTPRRLTSQGDHFEAYPRFSRDGQHIVYVSWDDEELGSVRIVSANGGEGRVITNQPGHYRNPVFTPDGKNVLYEKRSGGWLASQHWSRDPGIYCVAAAGGQPVRVSKKGRKPQFGADSNRVYLISRDSDKDADNLELFSIELDGTDKRNHFKSTWATDYCVSPDGKWVAFRERYNVFLAPFVQTGKQVDVGPKGSALPIAKASHDAGEWIHFSGDGKRLHWMLGATLYSRELTDSFAYLQGAPEELPEPTTTGIAIGFKHAEDRPATRLALAGGRVVTMEGDRIINDAVIVVEGNKITQVGSRSEVRIPEGVEVRDVSGQTILPGFVDTHAHGSQAEGGIVPQQNWTDYARLSFGVTTIHDPSNNTNDVFAASELGRAGMAVGPRIYSTGTILYGATGAFKADIDELEDARFHLRRMQAMGAFSVKSYNQPRRDQRQQILAAARELEMMVVPEGGATFMHNMTMVVDGHTGIEHTLSVRSVYGDVLDLWRGSGVGYTPTLSVAYGGLGGENYWYDVDEVWKNARVAAFIPPHVIKPRAKRRQKAPLEDYNHIHVAAITKQLVDDGGLVQAGGHGQLNGLSTHWEMWMFVQGGMTPFEALRSGTLHGATYIGLDDELGSIRPGKLADFIVYEKGRDPLKNIRDSDDIELVISNGRVYESKTMNQLYPEAMSRKDFYWQTEGFSPGALPPAQLGCHGCGLPGMGSWIPDEH